LLIAGALLGRAEEAVQVRSGASRARIAHADVATTALQADRM
jgi:hypothetical protein